MTIRNPATVEVMSHRKSESSACRSSPQLDSLDHLGDRPDTA